MTIRDLWAWLVEIFNDVSEDEEPEGMLVVEAEDSEQQHDNSELA